MPVPDFQAFMLPWLQVLGDGDIHSLEEIREVIAEQFQLTEDDKNELLPSGKQSVFHNRVAWAGTYLRKAHLVERVERARFRITPRGREVLATNPGKIDKQFLMRFPEFVEFHQGSRRTRVSRENDSVTANEANTPEETLEASYQELRRELAQELLERVKQCSPSFFEKLVVDLLVAMGYGGSRADAGQAIGRSGDDGVDGIIKEDKLGLDVIYIQAKRWDGPVGRPVVQAFAGSLEGLRARKGVLITTSKFTNEAKEYVNRIEKKIVLIDGERLTELMIDHDIGTTKVVSYDIKKLDSDYFVED